uniref:Acyl-CoA-binding domain-containing protein 4 n=1 Tax=Lygus hesperus TaxID=30085 RepID=A0A0A9YSX9_LYGHE
MFRQGHRLIGWGLMNKEIGGELRRTVQPQFPMRSYGNLGGFPDGKQLVLSRFPRLSIALRSAFQTSAINNDSCLPTALPPKCGPTNCTIPKPNIWKDCKAKKRPKWKGCEKICMPCCCPAWSPPDCDSIEIRQNTCKRLEYRIPSFSECRKVPLGTKSKKECCYKEPPCPEAGIENIIEPLISTKVRQETILGRRRAGNSARSFSTSAVVLKIDANSCKRSSQPCLRPSGVSSSNPKANKKNCQKQCMPCCPPARDPPECYYPHVKVKCERKKPPRPAFSECDKEDIKKVPECECTIKRSPPCSQSQRSAVGSC